MNDNESSKAASSTRREFLKTTAVAAAAGSAVAANLGIVANVHAAGDEVIKVGLIGCGGRGTGADQSVRSAPNVKLVALGDVFKDRLEGARNSLRKLGSKADVPDDRCFVGFDAYKQVIDSGVDVVILATPPGFRPLHLQAAVAAGKHIFTEKPVAVDATGVRTVLAAYEEAKKKKLAIAAGTQRRHQTGYLETMKQIHGGAIGDLVGGRCYWNQGSLWHKDRSSEMTDVEWQIRNWLYFTWLSGDHICEQHVHNLDVMNWAFQTHPVRAVGMGGRQYRVDPTKFGNIFDHFAIDLEYPNGVHVMSMCRQIPGCENSVSEALIGTKGFCQVNSYTINGKKALARGKDNEPYVQEHTDLIESIRAGKPINELKNVAESTMTAIMSRMSAYTGKAVTWDQALNSKEDLVPHKFDWAMSLPVPPVPMPGKTPLV
jgi:myo-inositol 2-dehydrogenase/D-chiro-inositol 1-dehydrogenase